MSERIQRQAQKQARARRRREKNARERAAASRERDDPQLARLHERAADAQADAAADSERVIAVDQEIEGDKLND